jgi:hypothetical protein
MSLVAVAELPDQQRRLARPRRIVLAAARLAQRWGVRMSIADQPLRTDRIDGPSDPRRAARPRHRPLAAGHARASGDLVMTVLAALLVWFALVAPDRSTAWGPAHSYAFQSKVS